jgi:hypothetical protein
VTRALLLSILAPACAATLLLAAAARAGEPPPPSEAPRPTPREPSDAARPASWSAPPRPRVTAGVLVRAAKRAQQRDPPSCSPCTARPPDEPAQTSKGAIESLEIDWNADRPSP